jgi:hypothetical protein
MTQLAHYIDTIENSLRLQQKMPLRSDQYGDDVTFLDLAADNVGLDELDTPNWQIVFGRRGTGKTHLLRTFAEITNQSFNKKKRLAIYLSASDFVISDSKAGPSRKTSAYFEIFLDLLTARLLDAVDRLLRDAHFITVLIHNVTRTKDRLESLALELREIANDGAVISVLGERNEEINIVEKASSDADAHANAKIGLDFKPSHADGKFGVDLGANFAKKRNFETTRKEDLKPMRALRADLVRTKLVELIDTAKIDCLYILIDEWPQLDPTGDASIQPEFANLLRRCLGNARQVSLKIASNRYQTKLSYDHSTRGKVGLELNADIFEAINLDHALLAEKELREFYETLIFKRLCHCEPSLKSKFGVSKNGATTKNLTDVPLAKLRPVNGFIEQIFADEQSFIELIKGCEGIPREFIVLFNVASLKNNYDIHKRWTKGQIQVIIRDKRVFSRAEELDYNSAAYVLLHKHVRELVLRNRVRVVGFRTGDISVESLIDELLEKRILHEVPKTLVPMAYRDEVEFYLVDYGYCLDWMRGFGPAAAGEKVEEIIDFRFDSATDIDALVVEIGALSPKVIACPHCKRKFSIEAKAYATKKLCPECFESVEATPVPAKPRLPTKTAQKRKPTVEPRLRKPAKSSSPVYFV